MNRIRNFFRGDRIKLSLHWSFSAFCLLIALLHVWLAFVNDYPGIIPAVVFAITAILFCPLVKAPLWMKFILGILLVVAT